MNISKVLSPPRKPATQYPADWEVRRISMDDDLKYHTQERPADDKNVRLWAVVYGVVGVLACIVILAMADFGQPGRFLIYMACANVAAFGLRLTSNQSVLPAGFLFLLIGIGDLTLPELLFIALSITLQRELRALRCMQDFRRVLYAVASVTIGLSAAQPTYKTILQLTDNAIFPAPIIASAFVLMINCGLSVMLLTKPKEPILDTYRTECRPLLKWSVATAYFAYLVQCAGIRTGYHP